MDSKFKPLLASPAPDQKCIRLPVLVSPKLDGIRVCVLDGKAVTRTLKEVPNRWISKLLSNPAFNGLDGEVIVGDPTAPDVFSKTTSAVMSQDGQPDFTFRVFDVFLEPDMPFRARYEELFCMLDGNPRQCDEVGTIPYSSTKPGFFSLSRNPDYPFIRIVRHEYAHDYEQVVALEELFVTAGFEGAMLRDPNAPYKFGRSTAKEGILLKVKRFADAEGRVIRVVEKMENRNPEYINELGYQVRSTAKAGMVPTGVLGALVVAFGDGMELSIGSGFTDAQRRDFWAKRKAIPGMLCRYKYQPSGGKDLPRFPVFAGFRHAKDMEIAA